jgi:histidine ammonia-lyase
VTRTCVARAQPKVVKTASQLKRHQGPHWGAQRAARPLRPLLFKTSEARQKHVRFQHQDAYPHRCPA